MILGVYTPILKRERIFPVYHALLDSQERLVKLDCFFWCTDNFDAILCPWKGYDLRPLYWIRDQCSNVTVELRINNTGSRVNDPPSWRHIVGKWPILTTVYTVDPKQNAYNYIYIHDGVPVSSLLQLQTLPSISTSWPFFSNPKTSGRCRYWRNWQDLRCNSMAVGWWFTTLTAVHSPPWIEIGPAQSPFHSDYEEYTILY